MHLANTRRRYGAVAISLHWLMAALIILLVVLGIYMVALPDAGFDRSKIRLILIHKEIGVVVLALAGLRLAWRQINPLPTLERTVPEWQQVAAVFVHLCFYALMVVQPVIGWLMSSASGIPVDFLGLFILPDLVGHDEDLFARLRQIHDWLGFVTAGVICLHAAAALRHHFVQRDDTLRKMIGTSRS
jgi:cytochrome b561